MSATTARASSSFSHSEAISESGSSHSTKLEMTKSTCSSLLSADPLPAREATSSSGQEERAAPGMTGETVLRSRASARTSERYRSPKGSTQPRSRAGADPRASEVLSELPRTAEPSRLASAQTRAQATSRASSSSPSPKSSEATSSDASSLRLRTSARESSSRPSPQRRTVGLTFTGPRASVATAQASIEGMPPSTTMRAEVFPRDDTMPRVPSATASQAMIDGSNTWGETASLRGPSSPLRTSAKTSASSNDGAWQASSPQGAATKLAPQKTSRSERPTGPTATIQAPMASASARKRDSRIEAPRALAASSVAKP